MKGKGRENNGKEGYKSRWKRKGREGDDQLSPLTFEIWPLHCWLLSALSFQMHVKSLHIVSYLILFINDKKSYESKARGVSRSRQSP